MDLKYHPYATMFPALDFDELDELANDIEQNGQRNPIWVDEDGLVLDGRNRAAACKLKGIEPRIETFHGTDEDKLHFVCSQNVHRRHLDAGQRAMIAAKLRDSFDALAKLRMEATQAKKGEKIGQAKGKENFPDPTRGQARDQAGAALNVSGKSVDMASKVIKQAAPEVVAAVEKGNLAVSRAAKIADLPKDQQIAAMEAAPTPRGKASTNELQVWFPTVNGNPILLYEVDMDDKKDDPDENGYAVFLTRHAAVSFSVHHFGDDEANECDAISANDILKAMR